MIFDQIQADHKIKVLEKSLELMMQVNNDLIEQNAMQRRALHKALQELAGYKGRESMKGGREALLK